MRTHIFVRLSVPPWWHLASRPLSGVCEATCPDPTEAMKAAKWGARRARRPAGGAGGQPFGIYQQVSSPAVCHESTCRARGQQLAQQSEVGEAVRAWLSPLTYALPKGYRSCAPKLPLRTIAPRGGHAISGDSHAGADTANAELFSPDQTSSEL